MDEFPGLLQRDFGLRPLGKGAPMASARTGAGSSARVGSGAGSSVLDGDLFGGDLQNSRRAQREDDDLFGGAAAPKYSSASPPFGSDPFFGMGTKPAESGSSSSLPVFDKPVYDDEEDIFGGVPGLKKSATAKTDVFGSSMYEDDLLAGFSSSRGSRSNGAARSGSSNAPSRSDDDIISGFGNSGDKKKSEASSSRFSPSFDGDLLDSLGGGKAFAEERRSGFTNHSPPSYGDDLLAGLGGVSIHPTKETRSQKKENISGFDDLIPGFGGSSNPSLKSGLSENKHQSSASSSKPSATVLDDPFVVLEKTSTSKFDDISGFDGFAKPTMSFPSQIGNNHKDSTQKASDPVLPKSANISNSLEPPRYVHKNEDSNLGDANNLKRSEESSVEDDDLWVTVSEIQLFTSPTAAPPPSRPPPPPTYRSRQGRSQRDGSSSHRKMGNDPFTTQVPPGSTWDGLEDFSMGKPPYGHEEDENPAAAAMKDAMDKAEAKIKHAREVRDRERDFKSFQNREVREESESEKDRLEQEREQREKEKEKEQRRLDKMREMELERERDREKARQAVERATREARERAAIEARQKAERVAREQVERAAVQRAQAEARGRAALEAKERAEKLAAERERAAVEARERAAAEARERTEAEAREREAREKALRERAAREKAAIERATSEARARAQRAAVERAAAEARERAAAEAREKAAAMAREKQQKSNDNDLDSFFGMGSRATSAPKERSTSSGSAFDAQFTNKVGSERGQRPSGVPSGMRRPSSTTNFMDDLTTVFSGKSTEEFQDIEGESEERRKARFEREQRTRQRTAKALAEKNERELQVQREQAERDRVSDTLNIEIKRWSAGKEGNLRALLSTLQYVLWPDSGWQPVSLTDLITAASVKKVYRKATLCVHPDKVVSGTVQQKYIAEKVFDLLKEAWNKFNSEELF